VPGAILFHYPLPSALQLLCLPMPVLISYQGAFGPVTLLGVYHCPQNPYIS
jgi:hypothetical protein